MMHYENDKREIKERNKRMMMYWISLDFPIFQGVKST